MLPRKALLLAGAGVLLAALGLGLALWVQARNAPASFLTGITNNAYSDFVKAGRDLTPRDAAQPIPDFVQENKAALETWRHALKQTFEAPPEIYNGDLQAYANQVMPNMALFKRLGQAAKAEGELAEEQGRPSAAAAIYLDVIEYGQKVQSGPLIFFLVGLASEDIGFKALQGVEQKLTDADRTEAATRLQDLLDQRIAFAEVLRREKYFMRRHAPTPIHYFVQLRLVRASFAEAEMKYDREVQAERDFLVQLRKAGKKIP